MKVTEGRQRMRAILAGNECVSAAPVFDPISARIAEDMGFTIGFPPSSVGESMVLGAPELGVITLTEFADQIHRICRASAISVMVVAHHGYGNALNVMRTVEELENAGVSAINIEDSTQRIGAGGMGGEGDWNLTPVEEFAGKIKAAVAARQDSGLVIVARTKALGLEGIPETIRRIKAYEKAGADAIFLSEADRTRLETRTRKEELEAIHAGTRMPLLLGMSWLGKEIGGRQFLAANGVRIVSLGPAPLLASIKAVYDTLKALRDGKSPADLKPTLASPDLMAQVTRQSQYNEWIRDFLN